MQTKKSELKAQLIAAQSSFHKLLESTSDEGKSKKSNNPGWTNGEILFHMLLGFLVVDMLLPMVKVFARLPKTYSKTFADILNFSTPLFNVSNAFGARMGARILSRSSTEKRFNTVINSLIKKLDRVKDSEWDQGMYYPSKWDGLFDKIYDYRKIIKISGQTFQFPSETNKLPWAYAHGILKCSLSRVYLVYIHTLTHVVLRSHYKKELEYFLI